MPSDEKLPAIPEDTGSLFRRTIADLAAGVTGAAGEGMRGVAVRFGHVFQGMMQGRLLKQLWDEWEDCKKKGRIKKDHEDSKLHASCLRELFEYLDGESLDSEVFEAIKRIFMIAALDTSISADDVLPPQYMRLCSGLTSGDVLVLSSAHRIQRESGSQRNANCVPGDVHHLIAERTGLAHRELVRECMGRLSDRNLVNPRLAGDNGTLALAALTTGLGQGLCDFIATYERLTSADAS
jgi:hypothetical protein